MPHPYYSLYCKQGELEQPWQLPWACGFASLVTCFRILGDRQTTNDELIAEFRRMGQSPHDGMTSDEAVDLAHVFGYGAAKYPQATRYDRDAFIRWLKDQWHHGNPVMLSVDSSGAEGESDHWWTVFGDPTESKMWAMEPLDNGQAFECLTIPEINEVRDV